MYNITEIQALPRHLLHVGDGQGMGLMHGDRLRLRERLDGGHTVESPESRCLEEGLQTVS